jgi:ABC-type uncharacterized transport system ATPase subunit
MAQSTLLSSRVDFVEAVEAGLLLSFNNVCKSFAGLKANDGISFDVKSGGIHALVGENGAGKSTLTKILNGYYCADSGSISLNGQQLRLTSPADARRQRIGMVHQQLALVPNLTVFENVVLGDPALPFCFRTKRLERRVADMAEAFGFNFSLAAPVETLGIAERQKLEIFKLLWRDCEVLILDEPTSQLTPLEADEILTLVDGLTRSSRDSGRIVILITHHIAEVKRFAERITVLRQGQCVATKDATALTTTEIAHMMVLPKATDDLRDAMPIKAEKGSSAQPLIELQNVSTKKSGSNRAISNVSMDVRAGEIVGVAGISSSGQNELGQLIAGLLPKSGGKLSYAPLAALRGSTRATETKPTASAVVSYIPCEQSMACALGLTVSTNSFLKTIDAACSHRFGIVKKGAIDKQAKALIADFQISPSLPGAAANELSGGNLQRLIIARELRSDRAVLVADNPCAGLDAAMAARVARELKDTAQSGRAVILISPDLSELISTCDRILIMFNGQIVGEQIAGAFDYKALALMMCGKIEAPLV